MDFFKKLYAKFLRGRANIFLKKFPICHLSANEYLKYCYALERSLAGVVLGYCNDGMEIKIISLFSSCELSFAEPIPLGYCGEIIYRFAGKHWIRTSFCGFIDQRKRVWCCGEIKDIIKSQGEIFYPYCIEPIFENLIFVHRAKLIRSQMGAPVLRIKLGFLFRWKILRNFLRSILYNFAQRFEKTKHIRKITLK